jgi:hypothetical protein
VYVLLCAAYIRISAESTSSALISSTRVRRADALKHAPFLRSLAARQRAISTQSIPSVPNTNKALLEIFCGYTPMLVRCRRRGLATVGHGRAFMGLARFHAAAR